MFQTEINHWLQSYSSDIVTFIMITITRMGYQSFFTLVFVVLLFGINFRKGFYLTHILIVTYALTEILKNFFALPRPSEADSSLKLFLKNEVNTSPFYKMGAKSFFSLPYPEVINYYRNVPGYSFGLPSGHVSSTTALWGSLYYLFKKKWIMVIGIVIIFLMMVSRMFLAKHFLADVLGGLITGSFMVAAGCILVLKNNKIDKLIIYNNLFTLPSIQKLIQLSYFFAFPLVLMLIPTLNYRVPAALLGFNAAYIFISIKGIPSDDGTIIQRSSRVILGVVIYLLLSIILTNLIEIINIDGRLILFIKTFVTIMFMIILTIGLGLKFNLYNNEKSGGS